MIMKKFKKLRRKGFAFTLVLAMCAGNMPVTAFALEEEAPSVDTISISSGGEISVNGKAAAEPVSASVKSSVEPSTKDEGSGNTNEPANTNTLTETNKGNNTDNAGNTTQEGTADTTEQKAPADKVEAEKPTVGNAPEQENTLEVPETTEQKEQTEPTVNTVKLPEEVEIEIEAGKTKTETVRPDGVPDGVELDKDGNYTWTVETDKGGTNEETATVPVPTDEELAKDWAKGESKTETGKDADGKPFTKVIEIYTKTDVNGVVTTYTKTTVTHSTGVEGEEVDTEKTGTQTTTTQTTTTVTDSTTTTTTVAPAKVTVKMEPVENNKDEIGVDVTGATVLVKNDKDGGYAADIKLNLSGIKTDKGDVTLTVTDGSGKAYTTTLTKVDENGNYTLEGINIDGLNNGEAKTVKLTLTGTQVEKVVNATTKAAEKTEKHFWSFGDDGTEKTLSEEEQKLVETFLEKLEVTEGFVIYADVYDAKNNGKDHVNGNICVNEMKGGSTSINIPDVGNVKADSNEKKQETMESYVKNGYSYVDKITEDGQISRVTNNITDSSGKKIPATLVVGPTVDTSPKTVGDQTNGSFTIKQLDGDMFDTSGKLTDEAAEKLAKEDPKFADIADELKINENLTAIAEAGQKLMGESGDLDADYKKITAVTELLKKGALKKDDVVSITIGIDTLISTENREEYNQKMYLTDLVNENTNGATIIINVDMGENPPTEVKINKKIERVGDYDGKAAHLIWNFGEYGGTIKFAEANPYYNNPDDMFA